MGNIEVYSVYHKVGTGGERLCMCEDEDNANKIMNALLFFTTNEEFDVIHEEIIANVNFDIKEW